MNNYWYLAVWLGMLPLSICAQYQAALDQTYELSGRNKVSLDLEFATLIHIEAWEKQEISLQARIESNLETPEQYHKLNFSKANDQLIIATTLDFDAIKQLNKGDCNQYKNGVIIRSGDCIEYDIRYELRLPANVEMKLETVSGDVEITGLTSAIQAKSISGFLDLSWKSNAQNDLNFKSVTGQLYSDFDLKLTDNSTAYHKVLKESINGGGPLINLETVSGDIFFRKQ